MINNFWNWLVEVTGNALNMLNTMYNNTTMKPFFDLALVVITTILIMTYIVWPLLTGGKGSSDKVKKNKKEEE